MPPSPKATLLFELVIRIKVAVVMVKQNERTNGVDKNITDK